MYKVKYATGVTADLKGIMRGRRSELLNQIELQLRDEPARQTRNRKLLIGLVPPWDHVPPVWELRIGGYRIFYDVNADEAEVVVRAIRYKPPHKTTEEIL